MSEGTLKITSINLSAMGRDTFHQTSQLKTPSNLALNTARDGVLAASLGIFQGVISLFWPFFSLFASNPTLQQPSARALSAEPAPYSNSARTSPCCPALSPALTEPCSSMPTRRRMHSHLHTSRPCCPRVAQAHMFQPRSLGSPCGQSWD